MEFFDTNILVYTVDPAESERRPLAVDLVRRAVRDGVFVISTQVILEFYATSLRRKLVAPALAKELLQEWAGHDAVSTTAESLWHAFDLQQRWGFSIWDAMIVQAALEAHCDVLYSEDLQHDQQIESLRIVNPFRSAAVHEPAAPYKSRGTSSRSSQRARAAKAPAKRGRTQR